MSVNGNGERIPSLGTPSALRSRIVIREDSAHSQESPSGSDGADAPAPKTVQPGASDQPAPKSGGAPRQRKITSLSAGSTTPGSTSSSSSEVVASASSAAPAADSPSARGAPSKGFSPRKDAPAGGLQVPGRPGMTRAASLTQLLGHRSSAAPASASSGDPQAQAQALDHFRAKYAGAAAAAAAAAAAKGRGVLPPLRGRLHSCSHSSDEDDNSATRGKSPKGSGIREKSPNRPHASSSSSSSDIVRAKDDFPPSAGPGVPAEFSEAAALLGADVQAGTALEDPQSFAKRNDDDGKAAKTSWTARLRSYLHKLTSHENRERRQFDAIVAVFVMLGAFTIPMRIAFRTSWTSPHFLVTCWVLDYIGDVLFLADIVLRFYTPFIRRGVIVSAPDEIRAHYLRTWFFVDLLASLACPASIITLGLTHSVLKTCCARLPIFLRIGHMPSTIEVFEQRTSYPFVVRVLNLLMWFVYLVHWLGCMYILASYSNGFADTTDPDLAWTPTDQFLRYQLFEQYIYTFFWSANQLTNTGGAPGRPNTIFEQFFELVVALIALFVVAAIIGSVGQVISEYDKNLGRFREKLDVINLFMAMKDIPEPLQDKVRSHFISQFRRNNGVETENVLQQLPINLRTEVSLIINADILKKVSFFTASSESFVASLAPFLRSAVFSPGDVIVKEGQTGSEMYFIGSGEVKVSVEGYVVATLSEGRYFGELSLFSEESVRTATVEAGTFCEVYMLSKRDLERVLEQHAPEARRIKQDVKQRLHQDALKKALKHVAFPSRFVSRAFIEESENMFKRYRPPVDDAAAGTEGPSHARRAEIRQAFTLFDVDGSGELDANEVDRAIATLGFDPHDPKMMEFRRKLDKDGSGTINLAEFEAMMAVLLAELSDDSSTSDGAGSSMASQDSDSDRRYLFLKSSPADTIYFVAEGCVYITARKHHEILATIDTTEALLDSHEVAVIEEGSFFGSIHAGVQGVYARTSKHFTLFCMSQTAYQIFGNAFPQYRNVLRAFVKRFAHPSAYFDGEVATPGVAHATPTFASAAASSAAAATAGASATAGALASPGHREPTPRRGSSTPTGANAPAAGASATAAPGTNAAAPGGAPATGAPAIASPQIMLDHAAAAAAATAAAAAAAASGNKVAKPRTVASRLVEGSPRNRGMSISNAHQRLRPKAKLKALLDSALDVMDSAITASRHAARRAARHAASKAAKAAAGQAAGMAAPHVAPKPDDAAEGESPLLGSAELTLNAQEKASIFGEYTHQQVSHLSRVLHILGATVSDELYRRAQKLEDEQSSSEDNYAMQELGLSSDEV